ncbi:hypothetical protein [Falsigemmobacter faecalis]|uniref:Uncharacterized protein n=1 Tax=Falsigemmobacter faecalis TaxID=2488730 RepID=A0A3P3DAK4_9RHOB|nr:hypothetical protein [Falsigemmobacter faecalis]RRH71383.1 hypothetical protein EG244_16335 [Falsigemmobacter faecalis]
MTRSLSTARVFLVFFEIVGWIAVAVGAFLLLWAFAQSSPQYLVAAVCLLLGGLVQVVFTQIARAQVETAENSALAVDLLRNIYSTLQRPASPLEHGTEGSRPMVGPATYRAPANRIPKNSAGHYVVGEQTFVNLAEAQQALKLSRRS